MAFTVEDGTGVSGANSYGSVADANTHWSDRTDDDDVWENADTSDKESALIDATDYIEGTYSWIGEKKSKDQGLGWPRSDCGRQRRLCDLLRHCPAESEGGDLLSRKGETRRSPSPLGG